MKTFSQYLRHRASTEGTTNWISDVDGRAATYAEIDSRATLVASALAANGFVAGSRILINAGNSIEFIGVILGVLRAGCVAVPVNAALAGAMLSHVCRDADSNILFADAQSAARFKDIAAEVPAVSRIITIDTDGEGFETLEDFLKSGSDHSFEEPHIAMSDVAAILYTSGTTGPSKGVMLPHEHLYQSAIHYVQQLRLTNEDSIYCTLPMFHLNGLTLQLFASLIVGCPFTFRRHFSASSWLGDVQRSKATVTNMLGSMTEFLFAQPETAADAENNLRNIVAAPIPQSLRERFEKRYGLRLVELYGMTEITSPFYMPVDGSGPAGSCGRLLEDSFEVAIVDFDTDLPVPVGSVGELVVRPRNPFGFMAGYFRRPEATVAAWRNLWFHTGDVMRADENGFYYFVDRVKDCVRRRGENISTYEVEQVLLQIEGVNEVAVIGVPSPFTEGEQEIMAVMVASESFDPQGAFDYFVKQLPRFAVPRIFELVDSLPKTGTGKVQKAELRKRGITQACNFWPEVSQRTAR
ncbi:MAG: AMP-binding protein [Rhizobiaceae bacterium]|nr:AMP-binding protein [Rhizobiaceae bacterium]